MRSAWGSVIAAVCSNVVLLMGVGAATASSWTSAAVDDPSNYTARSDITTETGMAVSIVYVCEVEGDQRLDIVLPAMPFNASFFGDEKVGVAWNWKAATLDNIISPNKGVVFEQVTINRAPGPDDGLIVLSFASTSAKILDSAFRLSTAERPVSFGLFALGRKAAIGPSDMLISMDIPVGGAAEAFGKTYALCGLGT